ncbi:MAG: hypothetical protein WB239_08390 [Acidimicrobiia bacterium]
MSGQVPGIGAADSKAEVTAPSSERAPLALVKTLAMRLEAEGIVYCHWKSNEAIDRSESGQNDLDLLVARRDQDRFTLLLEELGFLPARVVRSRRVPGISDYYGLDPDSALLVHVHAHTRLMVGDDMTKNFHLPLEEAYLASVFRAGILAIPRPEFEYLVFVLRMAVKHCPFDAVVMGKGRLTESERRELAYLEGRIDPGQLALVRSRELPWLSEESLTRLRRGLDPGAGLWARARVGREVTRVLSRFGRRGGIVDLILRVGRRLLRRAEARWWPDHSSKLLGRRGAVVAIVGGDGSGKSSTVAALSSRLGGPFRVEKAHLGKPPRSLLTRVVRKALTMLGQNSMGSAHPAWDDFAEGRPGLGFIIGNVLVARDRMLQGRRIRKAAARGRLIITDRFPLPQLVTMDTPRNARVAQRYPGFATRVLARLETRFYAGLGSPDVTVVLRVSPEVALMRRPEQDAEFVRRRAQEVVETKWDGDAVFVLDADEGREAVDVNVLRAVWRGLVRREQ